LLHLPFIFRAVFPAFFWIKVDFIGAHPVFPVCVPIKHSLASSTYGKHGPCITNGSARVRDPRILPFSKEIRRPARFNDRPSRPGCAVAGTAALLPAGARPASWPCPVLP